MPAPPRWLVRLPDILRDLQKMHVPVVDRAAVETLFGVRRRRAIQMMGEFGGFQSGRTFLVDRAALILHLSLLAEGSEFEHEHRRRNHLSHELAAIRQRAQAARVFIPVSPDVRQTRLANLPGGVLLERGKLVVLFEGSDDLLQKLFALSQALANDFGILQAFLDQNEPGPAPDAETVREAGGEVGCASSGPARSPKTNASERISRAREE